MSDSVREAFERWHDGLFDISATTVVKNEYGYPQNAVIQMRWQTWQAATASTEAKWRGLVEKLVEALKLAEYEFNEIRARDGAPQHIHWFEGRPLQTSSCTHEWWDEMTNKCGEALAQAEQLMGRKQMTQKPDNPQAWRA